MYYSYMLKTWLKNTLGLLGVTPNATSHAEKTISVIGGFIGIALTMWVSFHYLGPQGGVLLVASMGASAVLLFAVPHGALSQPWPLLGGNVISAVIGVACAQSVDEPMIAAPLSVALAIGAMHYLRCIHPPGGATAITAVIGGLDVHALGYQYVLTPVLLNVCIMLVLAIAVNYAFPWRRYPAGFNKRVVAAPVSQTAVSQTSGQNTSNQLSHHDFAYALRELDSYVDVSVDDLAKIYRLAVKHGHQLTDQPEQIHAGLYYSNGEFGDLAAVRKVIELSGDVAGGDGQVSFRVVEGEGRGTEATVKLAEFASWQKYEVILKDGSWHRIRQMCA